MKRNLSLWSGLTAAVGLLALVLAPVQAQQAAPANAASMGKIHGRVINPTGQPQGAGSVSLSTDGGVTLKYTFPVSDTGDYSGEAPAGTYMLVYRAPDTPAGKMVDSIRGVKIVAGEDTTQDDDMSRQEYIDKMSPDEKKQLEELKKTNAEAMKANQLISLLNADLRNVSQDKREIDGANASAAQALGATASKADIEAKANEIKTAKYTDIESMMTKDTGLKPDEALLWVNLGYGQAGLKKYDDATTSYKKAIDLESASKKPRGGVLGLANAGLGEIYARTGKVQEANAAYDAAAKADPANAALHLRNEAVIFFQQNNGPAQVAAADEAIKVDPNQAILYYIKGQGLVQNATVDPKTQRIVLPPDCTAAYQKYLELAPNGPYAAEVAGILQQAGEKVSSSYKASKSK
jgi:tetratricopeptide (TPR) repeat protein